MKAQDLTTLMNTDRLSWHRVGMVARFYWPRLRMQLLFFCLAVLVTGLFSRFIISDGSEEQIALISLPVTIMQYCCFLAPVILAFPNDQANCLTLPALGSEKCIFLLFWFFIAVPASMLIILKLCYFDVSLTEYYSQLNVNNITIEQIIPSGAFLSNITSNVAWTATCLWIVSATSRRRTMKAVLISLGLMIAYGIIFGLFTVKEMINRMGSLDNAERLNPQVAVENTMEILSSSLPVIIIVTSIYAVFAIVMACRAICRKQI